MPSTKRCLFGCTTTGVTIHKFPNLWNNPEYFKKWVDILGGYVTGLTNEQIHKSKSVCDRHFSANFKNRNNRLNSTAIPTLQLSSVTIHKFPNLWNNPEYFKKWVDILGGYVTGLTNEQIHKSKSVCDRHFSANFKNRNNRLNSTAIPTLQLSRFDEDNEQLQAPHTLYLPGPESSTALSDFCDDLDHDVSSTPQLSVTDREPPNDELKTKSSTLDKTANQYHLTTKRAVELLLEGTLKTKVCRYCLTVTAELSELDQIMNIGESGNIYKITIRDIVASFHPFKGTDDPNFPNRICEKCIDRALGAYLFTQQCDRAERAMLNCFNDIYKEFVKLDYIERPKKRSWQKLNPNCNNRLLAKHCRVIDYAEPRIKIVNLCAEAVAKQPDSTNLKFKRCSQVLPNLESNHVKTHSKPLLRGKSFPKSNQFKSHHKRVRFLRKVLRPRLENDFKCLECGLTTDNHIRHLQHIEKHKFKNIIEHLVEKKMDMLCAVCFNKGTNMSDLDDMVSVHGGHPALMGDKSLTTLLTTALPDMTQISNLIGRKICDKCLNTAITSYVFIQQHNFARQRLKNCVTRMLNNIKNIDPDANVFVEISPETIMPGIEAIVTEEVPVVETLRKKEISRIEETSIKEKENAPINESVVTTGVMYTDFSDNPAKYAPSPYLNDDELNRLHIKELMDVISEFLTFNT